MRHKPVILTVLLLLLAACQPVHDAGSISVVMCPGCRQAFLESFQAAGTVHCALYDLGQEAIAGLKAVHSQVITDKDTHPGFGVPYYHSGLMHDKFCVVDGKTVVTGSYNPTDGGENNRNNLLVIDSKVLASNYEKEFSSMKSYSSRGSVQHVLWINDTRVENYFCPQDGCEQHVLATLEKAQRSIVFMTYAFTSDPIGELLLEKEKQGVQVHGVCDKGIDQYSECPKLSAKVYYGEGLMHHKVFVIDNETVITGSYNPTSYADESNRENILVIQDSAIAQLYMQEYYSVLSESR